MALVLHYHPLSSYCHKLLIALRELGVAYEPRLLNLGDPTERASFLALWPTGKMPLLVDDGRVVAETSIQIEYLGARHAGAGPSLIPTEAESALEVRLMDRLSDQYVMTPMQAIVGDRLRPKDARDPLGVTQARDKLAMAYGLLEQRLSDGREWLAGPGFSMADCAAAPALFYAFTLVPPGDEHAALKAYFERLVIRPSVAATIAEAQPFFRFYPYREAIPARFLGASPV